MGAKLPDPAQRYEIADNLYDELITWCAFHAVITEYAEVVRDFYPGHRGYPEWLRW